jgi:hypothetical protein
VASGGGDAAPATSAGGWTWPARGPVTSEYGRRWGRMHEGIDIGAPTGAPVVAARPGRVSFVGTMGGYGNLVLVDHGGGIVTAYAHLSAFAVSNGAQVGAGQRLGSIGCTGSCTGPHLHFEVRVNGSARNPRNYLGLIRLAAPVLPGAPRCSPTRWGHLTRSRRSAARPRTSQSDATITTTGGRLGCPKATEVGMAGDDGFGPVMRSGTSQAGADVGSAAPAPPSHGRRRGLRPGDVGTRRRCAGAATSRRPVATGDGPDAVAVEMTGGPVSVGRRGHRVPGGAERSARSQRCSSSGCCSSRWAASVSWPTRARRSSASPSTGCSPQAPR